MENRKKKKEKRNENARQFSNDMKIENRDKWHCVANKRSHFQATPFLEFFNFLRRKGEEKKIEPEHIIRFGIMVYNTFTKLR